MVRKSNFSFSNPFESFVGTKLNDSMNNIKDDNPTKEPSIYCPCAIPLTDRLIIPFGFVIDKEILKTIDYFFLINDYNRSENLRMG